MNADRRPIIGGPAPRTAKRTARKLAGFANEHIRAIDTDDGPSRYLDVGCGNGFITSLVSGAFVEVHGIDMEPFCLAESREEVAGNTRYHIRQMSDRRLVCLSTGYSAPQFERPAAREGHRG